MLLKLTVYVEIAGHGVTGEYVAIDHTVTSSQDAPGVMRDEVVSALDSLKGVTVVLSTSEVVDNAYTRD
jgi:hypothetical protein